MFQFFRVETEDINQKKPIFQIFFFFYLGFLSRTFTIHRTAGEGESYPFITVVPLPPVSQTLRHQPGYCCREFTSARSQQPDSNREPLVTEHKPLTTKLRTLDFPSKRNSYMDITRTKLFSRNIFYIYILYCCSTISLLSYHISQLASSSGRSISCFKFS